jgi:hypothetical protein
METAMKKNEIDQEIMHNIKLMIPILQRLLLLSEDEHQIRVKLNIPTDSLAKNVEELNDFMHSVASYSSPANVKTLTDHSDQLSKQLSNQLTTLSLQETTDNIIEIADEKLKEMINNTTVQIASLVEEVNDAVEEVTIKINEVQSIREAQQLSNELDQMTNTVEQVTSGLQKEVGNVAENIKNMAIDAIEEVQHVHSVVDEPSTAASMTQKVSDIALENIDNVVEQVIMEVDDTMVDVSSLVNDNVEQITEKINDNNKTDDVLNNSLVDNTSSSDDTEIADQIKTLEIINSLYLDENNELKNVNSVKEANEIIHDLAELINQIAPNLNNNRFSTAESTALNKSLVEAADKLLPQLQNVVEI